MIGAEVYLWGTRIGTVTQENSVDLPKFKYDDSFVNSGIQVSPITMPLSTNIYRFPALNEETFKGLPGLLADSLPDKFGTALIDEYLARQGRPKSDLTPIERLCYIGTRGMGALEFKPQIGEEQSDKSIDIDELSRVANIILSNREALQVPADDHAISELIKVGTSAGGARAKALIAWNEALGDIRSGQIDAGSGYGYWLLKFGTIENNKDKDKESDHIEYAKIEYAYSLMAKDCGISMTECRLIRSPEGTHFATRRFDRDENTGQKIHMQTLGGLAHFDFNMPGAHSYEEAASVIRALNLPQTDTEQLYRRMVFNEVAKNYDDHVKNISFLMNRRGEWRLAPAYDMTFSYNPASLWTASHQMKINGKRENLTIEDLLTAGVSMGISKKKANMILRHVASVVKEWPQYARFAELGTEISEHIGRHHQYSESCAESGLELPTLEAAKRSGTPYSELYTRSAMV